MTTWGEGKLPKKTFRKPSSFICPSLTRKITNFEGHTAEQYTIITFRLVLIAPLNMDYNGFLGHFAET